MPRPPSDDSTGSRTAARLSTRLSPDERALYERAAETEGQYLDTWIRSTLTAAAERILREKSRKKTGHVDF